MKEVLEFAIKAHNGQVRKNEKDKPMIIHPITVANILMEYEFDNNVVKAGYLHDVVEDTKYTKDDILEMFGEDICSLVMGASEPNKSLSWEERKKYTIEKTKGLDLRHKAVICADKIANLEDLRIIFEKDMKRDFSAFNRGEEKQKWYYESIYNSLIENEDENMPMFVRLKEVIEYIFNNKRYNEYLSENIFNTNIEEYEELIKLHYKKQEIKKILDALEEKKKYVIEFTGTPRTGKTSIINCLKVFFKKAGFKVKILEEFTTSEKYKKDIYPLLKDKYKSIVNTEIPKYVLKELQKTLSEDFDVILIDRSLFDRLIWVDRLYLKDGMKAEEYTDYKNTYIPLIKENINIIVGTYTDSLTAIKRDYMANLSLEKSSFLNEQNVNEYNKSMLNMESLAKNENINFYEVDTTNINQRKSSFVIANIVLDDMREYYLNFLKEYTNSLK